MFYHVYILASATGGLYVGVANHRESRVAQLTKRYGVGRLVYFEPFRDVRNAISREKEIKGWRREKKLALIGSMNPTFGDLSLAFHS